MVGGPEVDDGGGGADGVFQFFAGSDEAGGERCEGRDLLPAFAEYSNRQLRLDQLRGDGLCKGGNDEIFDEAALVETVIGDAEAIHAGAQVIDDVAIDDRGITFQLAADQVPEKLMAGKI